VQPLLCTDISEKMPHRGSSVFDVLKMESLCFGGKIVAMYQIADCRGAESHCELSLF